MKHLMITAAATLLAGLATLPGELIDSIWLIIDLDLKGFIPLTNLLTFEVQNNHGRVTLLFSSTKSNRTRR